jgi:hypothetical protein
LGSPRGNPGNAEFAAAKAGLRMIPRSIAGAHVVDRAMAVLLD